MNLSLLQFSFKKKIKPVLQNEVSECGLACLVSILNFYGDYSDLRTLRQKFNLSLKGANLADIAKFAEQSNLSTRAIRADIDELKFLRLPCILHWEFNHFVVLYSVSETEVEIMNPATGNCKISKTELNQKFTGVALELFPNIDFIQKPKERKQSISVIEILKGIKSSLFQLFILACALEIFSLVNPLFLQIVIDKVIVSSDSDLLVALTMSFVVLTIFQQLTNLLQSWINIYFTNTLNIQWKMNIMQKLLHLPNSYFIKRHLGDILSRFSSIDNIQNVLVSTMTEVIINGIMIVITLSLMLFYSVKLSLIVILAVIINIILSILSYYPIRNANEKNIICNAKQNSYFMETIRGISTVKLFSKEQTRHNHWANLLAESINSGINSQRITIIFQFVKNIISSLSNILIIYLSAVSVLSGNFTVGIFTAFLAYKNRFETKSNALIEQYFQIKMLDIHTERLSDIVLEKEESIYSNNNNYVLPELYKNNISIEIKNLSFKYSENEDYIFKDINLSINCNEVTVFIGKSGCGKSTLMNILCGNLHAEKGEIVINGISNQYLLRHLSSTVLQEDVLFAGTIAENIAFFDENPNRQQIEICAHIAEIHNDIIKMPMGYETLIGDMGNILSGGQKQRIILARALYKKPRILLLDEFGSHLDFATEQQIHRNLKQLNIARVMIAHREETIKLADKVIDLSKIYSIT